MGKHFHAFENKEALCYSCKCEAWETETRNQQELAWQFPRYSVGCFTISVDLGFLRTCTLKCGYWQCHTSFLGESVTTKRKKSIDLAAQSGAANEVVSRYGSASKEHLVSYSGVDSQYINGIKIWNK